MVVGSPYAGVDLVDASVVDYVLGGAERHGDKPALVDGATGSRMSYRELTAAVGRVASGFVAQGVAKGDVVALCSPNSPDFVVALYGAWSAGAFVTTVNPLGTRDDLFRQLTHSGARCLVSTPELFEQKGRDAARSAGVGEVFVFGTADGATPFAALLGGADPSPAVEIDPDDLALLSYSSGTTGLPKGVVLTHRNLVASLCQMRTAQPVGPHDVLIAAVPLFHTYGMQVVLNLALHGGATVVTMPRFGLEAFLGLVQEHGVTRADLVPPIVLALAKQPAVDSYDLSTLRVITSGAAPLAVDVADACAVRIGCRVKQAYGMTELGGATHLAPDAGRDDPGSIGPALPGVECRVVDWISGEDVPVGGTGELLVRTPGQMRGYLQNPAATAETIDGEGWVHTGDIVSVDDEGWFRIVDRRKEMIKYKAYQVPPAELEAVLLSHPAVADAAVIGADDEEAGEVPKAFVVLRGPASADELLQFVADRVAPYKKVRRLEFVDGIPKSPSGKVLRRILVERDRAGRMAPVAPAGGRPMSATPNPTMERRRPEPEQELAGSVAVITGGGRGIGRVLAQALAQAGAAVGLVARSADPLDESVGLIEDAGGVAAAALADVSEEEPTAAAFAELERKLGPVDLLVNNAGISGPFGAAWEVDPEHWWRTLEVNLRGVFLCSRIVLPGMVLRRRGRIVNLTSYAGAFRWPEVSAYSVSKAAVIKFTENLAAETRRHGIGVFSVHPGIIPIGLSEPALAADVADDSPEGRVYGWVRRELAEGRGAEPEWVAELVVRLAAGRADALSGCHLSVHDDMDMVLSRIDEVRRRDLYVLRVGQLPG